MTNQFDGCVFSNAPTDLLTVNPSGGVTIVGDLTVESGTITITPKPAPVTEVTEADIERWLRDVPNAVIELLPASPARSNVRAAQHEVARLALLAREGKTDY